MKKKHGGHGHKAHHEMSGHHDPIMKKDAQAHASHHEANKEHGMPDGMAPTGGYEEGAGSSDMGCNEEHC